MSCVPYQPRGEKVELIRRRPQWQADGDGIYDVQYPGTTEANDRGKIVAEDDGTFCYRGILPTAYPVVSYCPDVKYYLTNSGQPSDGPGGDLLRTLGECLQDVCGPKAYKTPRLS